MDFLFCPSFYHLLLSWLLGMAVLIGCGSDRTKEENVHLNKRQSLKKKQLEAAISRKEVNSVVDRLDEQSAATPTCTRVSCVRNMPDATSTESVLADLYRQLEEGSTTSNQVVSKQLEVERTQSSPEDSKKSGQNNVKSGLKPSTEGL